MCNIVGHSTNCKSLNYAGRIIIHKAQICVVWRHLFAIRSGCHVKRVQRVHDHRQSNCAYLRTWILRRISFTIAHSASQFITIFRSVGEQFRRNSFEAIEIFAAYGIWSTQLMFKQPLNVSEQRVHYVQ